MRIGILVFDRFTEIDVFLHWDLFSRVPALVPSLKEDWEVLLLGEDETVCSFGGLSISTHGDLRAAQGVDAVIVSSGKGAKRAATRPEVLAQLQLDPTRQLIGGQCSGVVVLAALGLLEYGIATTYPGSTELVEGYGVEVVQRPLVLSGPRVATAGGCLAGIQLAGWMLTDLIGPANRDRVLNTLLPVGDSPQLYRENQSTFGRGM